MRISVRVTIAIVIAITVIYTVAGFLLVPWQLKRQISDILTERTGGEVTVGQLSVNPFLLSVDLRQLRIDSPDHRPIFSLESAQARLYFTSLWGPGWNIRELVLDEPHLQVSALPERSNDNGSITIGSIKHLQVKRGQLQWSGPLSGPVGADPLIDLTAIEFAMENLGSDPLKPGQFTLAAVVNRSGWIKSTGSLKTHPLGLDATVAFDGFKLAELDALMPGGSEPGQRLKILSGQLSGKLDILHEQGEMTIRGQAGLDQLELVDRANDAAVFSAAKVRAIELVIQSSPLRAAVEVLQLNKPHLWLARDARGTFRGGHWLRPLFDEPAQLQAIIQRIEVQEGFLDLADHSLASPYLLESDHVEGSITRQDGGTRMNMEGRVMAGSRSVLDAHWLPPGPRGHGRLDISVENLDATVLSPYLAALAGRGIASGQLDLRFNYRPGDQQFVLDNEIYALGLQLDEVRPSTVDPGLPLDLAVALLRDGNDRIKISIPVRPGRFYKAMRTGSLVSTGFVNLVRSITNAPFHTLGELAGGSSQQLELVEFMAGSAALAEPAAGNLAMLAAALVQRPGLGLKVNGRFDTVADRQALARKQVGLHVALATSAGPPGRAAPTAIDFNDSKVISVLDEFAAERLSAAELAALQANHPQRGTAYYAAVFEALVRNEAVSGTALKSLARFRAQTIVEQLKTAGVDPQRLQIGSEIETAQMHTQVVTVVLEIALLEARDQGQGRNRENKNTDSPRGPVFQL